MEFILGGGGGKVRPCPRAHVAKHNAFCYSVFENAFQFVSGKACLRLLFLIASNCLLEKRYYGYTSIHVF